MECLRDSLQVHVDSDDDLGVVRQAQTPHTIFHDTLHGRGDLGTSFGSTLDQCIVEKVAVSIDQK